MVTPARSGETRAAKGTPLMFGINGFFLLTRCSYKRLNRIRRLMYARDANAVGAQKQLIRRENKLNIMLGHMLI